MQHLPNELLVKIFEYTLEDIQQLLVLQQTCKRFYNMINQNDYLWYFLFKTIYPRWSLHIDYVYNKQPLIDWKHFVLELYRHKQHYTTHNVTLNSIIKTPYKIEEPFMSDMQSGMIALGKYKDHEYKISFFDYPSYAFLFEHTLHFTYESFILPWTCQVVGLQTIQINHRSIQLCAVALGQPVVFEDEEEQDILDTMDPRLNIWRTLLIYRIDHHRLTCLAHLNMADYPDSRLGFLGREVFFFSSTEQAWTQPWLEIISPDHASRVDMAYMLAFGPNLPRYGGRCYIVQLDVDGQETTLDPIQTELVWHPRLQRFIPHTQSTTSPSYPAQLITTVRLGSEVSCMYHFRHSPQLHHLICTGNYDTDEVSIWDWRFGIKVGLIPGGDKENIQPWGFETTWAIPTTHPTVFHGPRMIVVGDFEDKFEIKTWDISHLLTTVWDPFDTTPKEDEDEDEDMPFMYAWWHRGTSQLKYTATHPHSLPYTIPYEALLKVHELDAQVKYTAYSILQTLLYLLNAEGHLVVMDIESGNTLTTTQTPGMGVDVNVLGNKEIIITQKHELLRCLP